MLNVVLSELTRLRRRGFVVGWLGLTAVFAALINVVMFQVVSEGPAPSNGPGVAFPTLEHLLGRDGIVAGLAAASSLLGVVALAFWAIAASTDYSTGLVRLLVAAEPRRWRLLVGKWLSLALATALVTAVAFVVNLVVAPVAAGAAGFEPRAWGTDLPAVASGAALHLYLALLIWGTIGLALAGLTRSSGVAIGVGVGYVLLLESVVKAAVTGIGDWLPGTVITAVADGGTPDVPFGQALGLGSLYVVLALAAALVVFTRRDITD
jgi:ABC-2 type transport system permease protein